MRIQHTTQKLKLGCLIALLISAASLPVWARSEQLVQALPLPPDPCVSNVISLPGWNPVLEQDLPPPSGEADFSAGISVFHQDDGFLRLRRSQPVVLIVNGNGFDRSDYSDFATYLALQGFVAAVAERPHGVAYDFENFVLDSLEAVLDHQGLPMSTPVALVGHSYGGDFVLNAAAQNSSEGAGFNIRAVVGLAPTINAETADLGGQDADGLMLIYGSQDNDVEGLGSAANDAFAAYDRAGTEGSTTCHGQWCWFTPQLDKRMLFIHGADHAGLINQSPSCGLYPCEFPYQQYLSQQDQFCIAKGYTNAFLRFHLNGETVYQRMLEDRYRPPSIADITSNAFDAQGNPPGTPLRIMLQQSPKARSVVENFEDQAFSISHQTADVDVSLLAPGELIGPPENVRHDTHLARVSWPQRGQWQLVGFNTPAGRRDVRNFSHLAFRIGQLWTGGAGATVNPEGEAQSVLIGLWDGTASNWEWSHQWAEIPANDFRPGSDYTHSVMNTVAVPLTAFSGVDKANIRGVLIAFPAGSRGTLLLDNIEWFKR